MPVNLSAPVAAQLLPVAGVSLGTAEAGIKRADRKDLLVIKLEEGATVAGVFTTNRFCAAPVTVAKDHLATNKGIRALIVNTGNANAGTGEQGMVAARTTCAALAKLLGCAPEQVLPYSTGVIMEPLPVEKIIAGMPQAIANLKADNWFDAAHAIMTTDIVAKAVSKQVQIGGKTVTVTGMSKGSGMIHPNMATMLGYIATDAAIAQPMLQQRVSAAADRSFNCITVDGDTSTNDSFVVIATGASGYTIDSDASPHWPAVRDAVIGVAQELAQAIVHGPKVLFLDEPTNGLDPPARLRMIALIQEIRDRGDLHLLLSSHLLRDVEECCDEVLILKDGKVAANRTGAATKDTMKEWIGSIIK